MTERVDRPESGDVGISIDRNALGERLRSAREYLGLSQGDVAEFLGLSRPAVTNMETGNRKVSADELARLARLYHRPYEYFIGETTKEEMDITTAALYRTTRDLSDRDREQVLRFAQFLRAAGRAPEPDPAEPTS
ncbi:MAG: helix-turn-helix domain-containing protein [Pseudonocardiaceae bacterium]